MAPQDTPYDSQICSVEWSHTQRLRINSLVGQLTNLLLQKNYDAAYDLARSDVAEMENNGLISREESAHLLIDLHNLFLAHEDFGRASEIVKSASERFLDLGGHNRVAAEAYMSFADELFERHQYGWAASRYYNAAVIFIMDGNLVEARRCLERAFKRFMDMTREYWTAKLQKHLSILQETNSTEQQLEQLTRMQLEFRDMSRENWEEACKVGARKIKEKSGA